MNFKETCALKALEYYLNQGAFNYADQYQVIRNCSYIWQIAGVMQQYNANPSVDSGSFQGDFFNRIMATLADQTALLQKADADIKDALSAIGAALDAQAQEISTLVTDIKGLIGNGQSGSIPDELVTDFSGFASRLQNIATTIQGQSDTLKSADPGHAVVVNGGGTPAPEPAPVPEPAPEPAPVPEPAPAPAPEAPAQPTNTTI
jgi:predicted ATPase